MDPLADVQAARAYIECISIIAGEVDDTELQLTGWQVYQLLASVDDRLAKIEKELKKEG